jgi:hypothetical protein
MTMRYVDVALTDLEREFQLARSKPRHLAPQPKTSTAPVRTGIDGLIDSLVAAQHVMEMFCRSLQTVPLSPVPLSPVQCLAGVPGGRRDGIQAEGDSSVYPHRAAAG